MICSKESPFWESCGKAVAKLVGGGGGGRPNMAQAGGKNPAGVEDALKAAKEALEGQLA